MIEHTIWFRAPDRLLDQSARVTGEDNDDCLANAQIVWEALRAAGMHMVSQPPTGRW